MPSIRNPNRHEERRQSKLNRSQGWRRKHRIDYVRADAYFWHRRVIEAMKQNELVGDRLINGSMDRWLKNA